jgi:hypothetical protein
MSSIIGRLALGLRSKARHQANKAPKKKILAPIQHPVIKTPPKPEQSQSPLDVLEALRPAPVRTRTSHRKAALKTHSHKATPKKRSHHKKKGK